MSYDLPTEISSEFDDGQKLSIGFGRGVEGNYFHLDYQTLWYNLLLEGKSSLYRAARPLSPPSTHLWFEGEEHPTPRILSFVVGGQSGGAASAFKTDKANRTLNIHLPVDSEGAWVELGRRGISAFEKKFRQAQIGTSASGLQGRSWPWHDLEVEEGLSSDRLAARAVIRETMYELWLTACFAPQRTIEKAFIEKLIKENTPKILGPTAESEWNIFCEFIRTASEKIGSKRLQDRISKFTSGYNSWYIISTYSPIGEPIRAGAPAQTNIRSLGTGMILCEAPLDGALLEIISSWVRSMYLQLRNIETNSLERINSTAELSASFGHEVTKLGEGIHDIATVDLEKILEWAPPPFRLDPELEREKLIREWRVVALPALHDGFRSNFQAWGSAPVEEWFGASPFRLRKIIAGLEARARAVAASRRWLQESGRRPRSVEDCFKMNEGYHKTLDRIPKFELSFHPHDVIEDIEFRDDESAQRVQFLVRALLATMSNCAFHAPTAVDNRRMLIDVSLSPVGGERMLKFLFRNEIREGDRILRASVNPFSIKTEGVLRSCLNHLGGILVQFPSSKDYGVAETEFLVAPRVGRKKEDWFSICGRGAYNA